VNAWTRGKKRGIIWTKKKKGKGRGSSWNLSPKGNKREKKKDPIRGEGQEAVGGLLGKMGFKRHSEVRKKIVKGVIGKNPGQRIIAA